MALEEERAQRVKQLKQERPDLTWARIAEAVGVKERSVLEWQRTGGMDYANAKKFATLMGVSIDWLWSGVGDSAVPVPADDGSQLDRIEQMLEAVVDHLGISLEEDAGEELEREIAKAVGASGTSAGSSGVVGRVPRAASRRR